MLCLYHNTFSGLLISATQAGNAVIYFDDMELSPLANMKSFDDSSIAIPTPDFKHFISATSHY
jgi:hypothetical protein